MTGRTLTATFPAAGWAIPASTVSAGRYLLRFARTEADLENVLRLRFAVYHLEHHIGRADGHSSGLDEDDFDQRFHHLLIEDRDSREVVGTYRMQTAEMAADGGYASAELFDLDALPDAVRGMAVEAGRACIAKGHRNSRVLHLLWRGMASYLAWNRKTVVFGSCALPSQDQTLALTVHRHLEKLGASHPSLRVSPLPHAECRTPAVVPFRDHRIPDLFQAYLTLGAKLLGPPAVDRDFKTVNWLVLLDVNDLDQPTYRSFFR